MMVGDGRRGPGSKPEHRMWGLGHVWLFPNVGTKTEPRLGKGALLRHKDGSPFQCYLRTQITCVDWDHDSRTDLLLSSSHTPYAKNLPNRGVDFFRNVGTPRSPTFGAREPMKKLTAMLHAHHDVKLCAVDLTGNGVEDLVTSTDPGTRVIFRSFLDETPAAVRIIGFERRRTR